MGDKDFHYGERYGTVGWQEFLNQKHDILRKYESAKQVGRNRPTQTGHGNVGEACFREWFSGFLPKKFRVTSGFIIPDTRSVSYTLRHFDLIVYDALNSPELWAENNPDNSEEGKSRAIPAPYVCAVLEIKASLTRQSINDSIAKLKELNDFRSQLRNNFVSGSIFFEVAKQTQKSCKVLEYLSEPDVTGYYGGLILSAEAIDQNITGYFKFHDTDSKQLETEDEMPLVRDIGVIQKDANGNPLLTAQGDTCSAVSLDGKWNFDKGYSPIVKMVELVWSYNAFPQFAFDFLDLLNGVHPELKRFDPNAKMNHYGMSFSK